MSNNPTVNLISTENGGLIITNTGLSVLQRTICAGLNKDEIILFAQVCQSRGLDPFAGQIYAIKRGDRVTFQMGIDGLRSLAERTGDYLGQEDVIWYDEEGKEHTFWAVKTPPAACRVGVYRKGYERPIRVTIAYREYVSTAGPLWGRMPAHMLAKCCEALALRKAFPAVLGGIYTPDERLTDNGHTDINNRINQLTAANTQEAPRADGVGAADIRDMPNANGQAATST